MGIVTHKEIPMSQILEYDQRHGGAYDRGSADAWYGRPAEPHYFVGATYMSQRVDEQDMTPEEIEAYMAGYASTPFAQKEW
jgi:hypothetical protein